jgi:Abortive infection alpha
MTGGEIVLGTAAVAGKKALRDSSKTKAQLIEIAKDSNSPAIHAAAESLARRIAAKQMVLLKIYKPLGKWLGLASDYFETQLAIDMAERIADIPEEQLTIPTLSVAVPAMIGLSYSLDEPSLKEMYLNLLAQATDTRTASKAHPAFPEIIKQLSPREAALLQQILPYANLPIVNIQLRLHLEGVDISAFVQPSYISVTPPRDFGGIVILQSHILNTLDTSGNPVVEEQQPVWVENWIRLGLIHVDYSTALVDEETFYGLFALRPEVMALTAEHGTATQTVQLGKGVLTPTSFGRLFAQAVIFPAPHPSAPEAETTRIEPANGTETQ